MALSQLPELLSGCGPVGGIDEVGRGALFGPVVAAAVVLPPLAFPALAAAGVNDSKLLSSTQRSELDVLIRRWALAYGVGAASPAEIDRINILNATFLAMRRAFCKLHVRPALCIVDGNREVPDLGVSQLAIVGGDALSLVVAAASIVAKVWRDNLIIRLAERYPQFDLAANKGYGTVQHRKAIQRHGSSPMHRASFAPCRV